MHFSVGSYQFDPMPELGSVSILIAYSEFSQFQSIELRNECNFRTTPTKGVVL